MNVKQRFARLFGAKRRIYTYSPPSILPEDDGPLCIPRRCVGLRQQLARIGGYFWLPCPQCGFEFAGYEIGGSIDHPDPERALSVCRWCKQKVRAKSEVFPDAVKSCSDPYCDFPEPHGHGP